MMDHIEAVQRGFHRVALLRDTRCQNVSSYFSISEMETVVYIYEQKRAIITSCDASRRNI